MNEYEILKKEVQIFAEEISQALQNTEYFISTRQIKILKAFQDYEDKLKLQHDRELDIQWEEENKKYDHV